MEIKSEGARQTTEQRINQLEITYARIKEIVEAEQEEIIREFFETADGMIIIGIDPKLNRAIVEIAKDGKEFLGILYLDEETNYIEEVEIQELCRKVE